MINKALMPAKNMTRHEVVFIVIVLKIVGSLKPIVAVLWGFRQIRSERPKYLPRFCHKDHLWL